MKRVTSFLLLILLVIYGTAEGADRLRFAWPTDLKARVNVRIQGSRLVPTEEEHVWDVTASFDLETEKRDDEILIHRRNFDGWHGTMPTKVTWIGDQIVDRVPTMVVSRVGSFVGIEGATEARDAIRASAEDFGGVLQRDVTIFRNATSKAGLTAVCQDYWSTTVQMWLVNPLANGETRQMRNRTPVPQLGGGELDIIIDTENLGVRECSVEDCDVQCVELAYTSYPDEGQMKDIVATLTGAQRPVGMTQERQVSVLLDPNTMLPHEIRIFRKAQVELAIEGVDATLTAGEINSRTYQFSYK